MSEDEAVENIDIGGPTMVRAAAKNFTGVGIVTDPADYDAVLDELKAQRGRALARDPAHTWPPRPSTTPPTTTSAIANWFGGSEERLPRATSCSDFGQGPGPALRREPAPAGRLVLRRVAGGRAPAAALEQLHGPQLSFNNLLDLDSARRLLEEFALPCCVIVKHNNPCGVAVAETVAVAYEKALSCDPVSAFGGVIVVNRPWTRTLARLLSTNFVEVLWAPGYTEEALEILTVKKDIRILTGQLQPRHLRRLRHEARASAACWCRTGTARSDQRENMQVVSTRHPTEAEWGDLLFAWRVAKHTKSNAIILAKDLMTVGVGAGQMSRVDSASLAVQPAAASRWPARAVASDAFFPFPDALEVAADAGATCVIHPGGSKRDDESLALAEARGMAMVVTGRRHFRH